MRVGQLAGSSASHEHPHLVSAVSFRLDGMVGDQLVGDLDVEDAVGELERRHHATGNGDGTSATR
jgi:hypothetical protein